MSGGVSDGIYGVVGEASIEARTWPGFGWPWQAIADCESGKRDRSLTHLASIMPMTARWDIENPPYTGGVQFMLSTWRQAGGTRYAPTAGQATAEQQLTIAQEWLAKTNWHQWPDCSRRLRLR